MSVVEAYYSLTEPTLPGYRTLGSSQQGEDMELWYLERAPRREAESGRRGHNGRLRKRCPRSH